MNPKPPLDHRTALSRRKLLGGLGALTVAVTSPIWRTATVFGADAKVPAARRFIGVFSANGTIAKDFFPQNAANGAQLATFGPAPEFEAGGKRLRRPRSASQPPKRNAPAEPSSIGSRRRLTRTAAP